MKNPANCGFPDGAFHAHTDVCHRAGIALGRELERAEIVAFLREQAALHHHGPDDSKRRGALNYAADRLEAGQGVGRPDGMGAAAPEAAPMAASAEEVNDREPRPLGWLFRPQEARRG